MARSATGRPTDFELEILKVLWNRGASTVREVMDVLNQKRPVGYTTVLKMLQIMTDKGLVLCDKDQRVHVYRSRHPQKTIVQQLTEDLVDRVFEGSAQKLLVHALEQKKVKPDELRQIRRLLSEMEKK